MNHLHDFALPSPRQNMYIHMPSQGHVVLSCPASELKNVQMSSSMVFVMAWVKVDAWGHRDRYHDTRSHRDRRSQLTNQYNAIAMRLPCMGTKR